MIDPTVRTATDADAAQLELLEDEARSALVGERGGDRWLETHPPRAGGWTRLGAGAGVFVAHIGDVVVGYLVLAVDADIARIEEVYVTPAARELGFGDGMLERAIEHARRAGARLLEGEALPGDRDTKNLYERAGIKARLLTVSTPL